MTARGYVVIACDVRTAATCWRQSDTGRAGERPDEARTRLSVEGWRRIGPGIDACPSCLLVDHQQIRAEGGAR